MVILKSQSDTYWRESIIVLLYNNIDDPFVFVSSSIMQIRSTPTRYNNIIHHCRGRIKYCILVLIFNFFINIVIIIFLCKPISISKHII